MAPAATSSSADTHRRDAPHRRGGIAAHWKYKSGGVMVTARDEERLNWIRQLVDWQKEMTDPTNSSPA